MTEEKNQTVPILISKEGLTMIEGFLGRKKGCFILDTGTSNSILFMNPISNKSSQCEIRSYGKSKFGRKEESSITILGKEITKSFIVLPIKDIPYTFHQEILGIIGVDVMRENQLVIDYMHKEVHLNTTNTYAPPNECHAKYSMSIGLQVYGVPIVTIAKENDVACLIVDTGSISNIISSEAVIHGNFNYSLLEKQELLNFLGKDEIVEKIIMDYNIVSLADDYICKLPYKEEFSMKISNGCLFQKENNFPLDGILGNLFMIKEKWILDFSQENIYIQ